MSRWLGMYLAALFTVIFLPILFGIAVDLGMVQPLVRMSTHMQEALSQFSDAAEALALPSGAEAWRIAQWQDWLQGIPDSMLSALGGIVSILLGWLLSLVALIVGMLVGVYLLMNLPGFVGGFIGGIGASAATAFGLSRVSGGSRAYPPQSRASKATTPSSSSPPPSPKAGGSRSS